MGNILCTLSVTTLALGRYFVSGGYLFWIVGNYLIYRKVPKLLNIQYLSFITLGYVFYIVNYLVLNILKASVFNAECFWCLLLLQINAFIYTTTFQEYIFQKLKYAKKQHFYRPFLNCRDFPCKLCCPTGWLFCRRSQQSLGAWECHEGQQRGTLDCW